MAYAEDSIEDEAEVEGEADADVEEVGGIEEEDENKTTSSPHVHTTLLFVRPVSSSASRMGNTWMIIYVI